MLCGGRGDWACSKPDDDITVCNRGIGKAREIKGQNGRGQQSPVDATRRLKTTE